MLDNFEILRKNKIISLIVMFLVIGISVFILNVMHGYTLFETFNTTVKLICQQKGYDSEECQKNIRTSMS